MFPGYKILVVEDDYFSILLMKEFLNSLNVDIFDAKNGKAALEICKENEIDLIVTDILMPVMNGKVFLKNIKKICPDTKIIAETAYGTSDKLNEIKNAGFDAVITKPYRREEFIGLITDFLNKIKEEKETHRYQPTD